MIFIPIPFVLGVTLVTINLLKDEVLVDPIAVDPININTSDIDQLKIHPYIRYNVAKAIVNYREQHGPFSSVSELSKIHLIDSNLLVKLGAYLTVE